MTLASAVPHHTLEKQHEASNPAASVWVSANAGSGKTHVLTQRVVRLLLEGVAPSRILCLTFTKAAAANMAGRVFGLLARWTRLPDAELESSIRETGAPDPSRADLVAARKLFARTVETPGGLKIQTIHAFCEKLLHRFPFEANVPSRFEVADDLREAELLSRARREILAEATASGGTLGEALARVTEECGCADFEKLIREALGHRTILRAQGLFGPGDALRKGLGLAAGRTADSITCEMIEDGLSPGRLSEIVAFLATGKKTDQDRATLLGKTLEARQAAFFTCDTLTTWLAAFFTANGEGNPAKLLTKDLAAARPDIAADLHAEQVRLDRLREERKAAAACERTTALVVLVRAILARYDAMKSLRGILDFDDLIDRTSLLLERSDAAWVLYKLDSGIDHILVDEAQDTSEPQWRILDRLTSELAAGAARRGTARTFFAVGDEKQSIFSFQGAAPHMFAEMRRSFARRFSAQDRPFTHVSLTQSFRSVPAVLAAVDRVFAPPAHQQGLVADDIWMGHEALKAGLPGLVEIWPPVGAETGEPRSDWRLPLDLLDESDPAGLVAQRVAAEIGRLLAASSDERVHDSETHRPRRIRAGDIMVLVRTRNSFFEAVIRALKAAGVPVAGADRLELSSHIAVMDLVAAGRATLLPDDDLTVAALLKSPLVGLDDDDLLALAPRRAGRLLAALEASPEPRHRRAVERLACWRARAALGPFGFYARLLGEDGGRRALEGRLGPEACDAIDEFLRLALAEEQEAAPSLAGFLDTIEAMDGSIKRDMETSADSVRVMTVHAAKGLEAKIVFLPDTCSIPSPSHDPKLFVLGDSAGKALAWSPRKDCDPSGVAAARESSRQAAQEEYRRLLYVALTRAEERLYIAGFHGERAPGSSSWWAMIESTLSDLEGMEQVPAFWNPAETVSRWIFPSGAPAAAEEPRDGEPGRAAPDIPSWLFERTVPEPPVVTAVRPSHVREPARSGPDSRALQAGRLTHMLLQSLPGLPAQARRGAALEFLSGQGRDFSEAERATIAEEALTVMALPEITDLFGPNARAEVSVTGRIFLPEDASVEVSGRVDRLAVTETEVLVADFKTGRSSPKPSEADLTQMALYRAVLAPLWPEKAMRMILVFTSGPSVVRLDDASLDRALAHLVPG